MEGAVARRVAGRADEADAGRDLGLAGHLADVLPGREHRLDAPRQPLRASGSRSITAGSVQNLYSTSDTTISAFGKTGLLVSFSISPKMWSGWKCEIRMVSILAGIDAGRLHVGHHLAGGRLHLTAGAAVAQDGLAAVLDDDDRERDGDEVGRQAGLDHRAP